MMWVAKSVPWPCLMASILDWSTLTVHHLFYSIHISTLPNQFLGHALYSGTYQTSYRGKELEEEVIIFIKQIIKKRCREAHFKKKTKWIKILQVQWKAKECLMHHRFFTNYNLARSTSYIEWEKKEEKEKRSPFV